MGSDEQSYLSYFTPSQMSHEMLEAILVKRQGLAARLVERVKQSVLTEAKYQNLLLGPRGMGKSYLVALLYHRVKDFAELEGKIAIASFAEEEWSITSLTDLYLVILKALEREYGGLQTRIEALYRLPVREIGNAASALIREFVGERTLLLLMENLDEIFRGLGSEGQWAFRAFLNERPFVTILATTPSLFTGISDQKSAFYGFFNPIYLDELTVDEATELLEKVAARRNDTALAEFLQTPTARERVQAVHDLAGGHPRIYLLFAHLLTQETLDELVTPFLKLLDELTPYYQSRMQMLSPQQRKIIEFLCTARGAVAVKEIAVQNLMTPQTASAQLYALEEMAYVQKTPAGRESWYELREPLLRLVIELKRGRGEPVRLVVDFLRRWYSRQERQERLAFASPNHPLTREYMLAALDLERAVQDKPDLERAKRFSVEYAQCLEAKEFDRACEIAAEIIERKGKACDVNDWFQYGYCLNQTKQFEAAVPIWDKFVDNNVSDADIWSNKGDALSAIGNDAKALESYERSLEINPQHSNSWYSRLMSYMTLEKKMNFVEEIKQYIFFDSEKSNTTSVFRTLIYFLMVSYYKNYKEIPEIVQIYSDHNSLEILSEVLIVVTKAVLSTMTALAAEKWLAVWQSVPHEGTDLEILVRILAAAVEWKKTQDVRALLALPIEERRILESLLPKSENEETKP